MEEKTYSARQAAAALGVGKSTILRAWDKLPPEMKAQGSYRGQPTKLVTRAGLQKLAALLSAPQVNYAALDEANRSAQSAQGSESSEAKQGEANQAELIAELRERIAAQEQQLITLSAALEKATEATQSAQALHAATYARLRLLETEPPQEEAERERAASAPTNETEEAPPERASFAERLRFLFTGKTEKTERR